MLVRDYVSEGEEIEISVRAAADSDDGWEHFHTVDLGLANPNELAKRVELPFANDRANQLVINTLNQGTKSVRLPPSGLSGHESIIVERLPNGSIMVTGAII